MPLLLPVFICAACSKGGNTTPDPIPTPPAALVPVNLKLDNTVPSTTAVNYNVKANAAIRISFNNAVDRSSVSAAVFVAENGLFNTPVNFSYENSDSTVVITPAASLKYLTKYVFKDRKSVV